MKAIFAFLVVQTLLSVNAFAEAQDAGNLPQSCRVAVGDEMRRQGIDPEGWGSFLEVKYIQALIKNPNGTTRTGVARYIITIAHGDMYRVEVDYNQNTCKIVK